MDSINIGVLLPSSTIFPIAKEFEKGLKEGLQPLKDAGTEVELTKEFIGSGEIKLTENACKKLFNYDEVDLVTGILSNRAAAFIGERFKTQSIPLIIIGMGEYVPFVNDFNQYMFVSSMNLWRHAWSLGNFGVKQFGKKGMFIAPVYDAGYSFSQLFYMGMQAADPHSEWSFSVPPMPPAGSLSDVSVIFQFLEQYQPDFIFAVFCGAETTLFLNEFIVRGWHHKTKVLGLPYLLAPFEPLTSDITIYTTLPFEDTPLVSPQNAFRHLGLQAGKNITLAAQASTNSQQLRDELSRLNSMFNIADGKPDDNDSVTIVENTITAHQSHFDTKPLTNWPTLPLITNQMRPLVNDPSTGWFNPYLCI